MINYDYKCKDCGREFEVGTCFTCTLASDIACPDCHSFNTRRVYRPLTVVYNTYGYSKKVQPRSGLKNDEK